VVAISAEIMACSPVDIHEGFDTVAVDSGCTPSIFFLIDNSGSMTGKTVFDPGRDIWGSRFVVVRDMIDTIAKHFPDAEIGLGVFMQYLVFDTSSDEDYARLFQPLPQVYDDNPDQAYMPFLKLDSVYYQNKTGLEILKEVLETDTFDTIFSGDYKEYVDLKYTPNYKNESTNINIGFLAVKDAMKNAVNPKECQYLIFLSDGEPWGNIQAGLSDNWFITAEAMPTTFTVFFTADEDEEAPNTLVRMTDNIRANGYSIRNPSSDLWTLETNYDVLMELLMERVMDVVFETKLVYLTGKTDSIVFNGLKPQDRTDTTFVFEGRFPLQPEVTEIELDLQYTYTHQTTKEEIDSSLSVTFFIKREKGANLGDGVAKNCWEQPSLDLLYNGVSLADSFVSENMDTLEVRLTPNDEDLSEPEVDILSKLETEGFVLNEKGGYFSVEFPRVIGDVPTDNNGELTHFMSGDSIIVIWRNPEIPLDTVRIAVPFRIGRVLEMKAAYYFDTNADGYIDSIYVDMGVENLFEQDLPSLKQWVTLPPGRKWQNDSTVYQLSAGGFSIIVSEKKDRPPRTDVDSNDVISISENVFEHGGIISEATVYVQDRMSPVIVSANLILSDAGHDTLKILFSEDVLRVTAPQPFLFITKQGNPYTVSLEVLHGDSFEVISVEGIEFQKTGDSLWINIEGSVTDLNGNRQDNPYNRRVQLSVPPTDYVITPLTANNPAGNVRGRNPEQAGRTLEWARQIYEKSDMNAPKVNGPVIIARPEGRGVKRIDLLTGRIFIFDVVKNALCEADMAYDPDTRQLVYIWDMKNENDKPVATGTYMAVMKIHETDGSDFDVPPVRIGVIQ
jgi:hypothetical protein